VEVKNCHLVYPDGRAYFPDSISERATKHLRTLAAEARRGLRATVLFVVQREDARSLRPSRLHDPAFFDAATRARAAGVRFRALRARPDDAGLTALDTIPVELAAYDTTAHVGWRAALKPWSGWERPPKGPSRVTGP
jgi:sugar fermentation stimulation protein A